MTQRILYHFRRAGWLLVLLALVTAACAGQVSEPTLAPTSTAPPTESPTAPPPGAQPSAVIQQATEALAVALGVDASAIALVSMELPTRPWVACSLARWPPPSKRRAIGSS
jgi:hypothetical protein